jgi:DNA-directed RNA polymerase subunit alpha
LYLASLDSPDARLYVEFDIELSKGYREAEPADSLAVDVIPVDAIFTPIRKVNFTVEPVHIGQESSRERMHLEVWTDGTISPQEAVSQSAQILIEQLSPFASFTRVALVEPEKETISQSIPSEIYNMPVEQLNLSVRTLNCLRRGNITTVGEVMTKGQKELMSLRNFGQKSMQELKERFEALGLTLAP